MRYAEKPRKHQPTQRYSYSRMPYASKRVSRGFALPHAQSPLSTNSQEIG